MNLFVAHVTERRAWPFCCIWVFAIVYRFNSDSAVTLFLLNNPIFYLCFVKYLINPSLCCLDVLISILTKLLTGQTDKHDKYEIHNSANISNYQAHCSLFLKRTNLTAHQPTWPSSSHRPLGKRLKGPLLSGSALLFSHVTDLSRCFAT